MTSIGSSQALAARLPLAVLSIWMLADARPVAALCLLSPMEGRWVNADPNGVMKKIELRFKCCDQVLCPGGAPCTLVCNPKDDTVRVTGPCGTGDCDWGAAVPHYVFMDVANGPKYTRVDARFTVAGTKRELVILLLEPDSLLVHWSIDYPDGAPEKDVSFVEQFERLRCYTVGGTTVCVERVRPESRLRTVPSRQAGDAP